MRSLVSPQVRGMNKIQRPVITRSSESMAGDMSASDASAAVSATEQQPKRKTHWETPLLSGIVVSGLLYYAAGHTVLTVAAFAAAVSAASGMLFLPLLKSLKAQQVCTTHVHTS